MSIPARIGLFLWFLLGAGLLAADETVSGNLTVTGDAEIGGALSVTGDMDAQGDNFTFGTQSGSYGLGTFYQASGADGVRWRLRRSSGWLWEVDNSGVTPSMRLDSTNKLVLYTGGSPGVTLDPAAKSIALGDAVLYRDSNGDLKTDEGIVAVGAVTASNLSGTNTGDQTRADLGLDTTDDVTFSKVTANGQFVSSKSNNTATGGGQIFLNGSGGNRIDFAGVGYAPPSLGTRSIGTKIVLWPGNIATSADYAIGIEASVLWHSVPSPHEDFKWYGGTNLVMTLEGDGSLLHLKAATGTNDAKAVIQAGSEGSEAHLVLSTGYSGLDRRKTAIVADGTGGWSRADLHFVLDSVESTSDYTVGADTKMIIKNSGNVGIGTVSPSAKLSVNGGLHVGGDSDPGDNNLLVDGTIAASNFSGTSSGVNTGDQTRADLGLDTTDAVTFAAVNTTGLVTGANISGTNTGDTNFTSMVVDGRRYVTPVWDWSAPVRLSSPVTLPNNTVWNVRWSPDGRFVAAMGMNAPYLNIYERNGDSFTKLSNPSILPSTTAGDAEWSPDGNLLIVWYTASPYLIIYRRTGNTFTKIDNPAAMPAGAVNTPRFSPAGDMLVMGSDSSPYLNLYDVKGTTFTKLSDPASLPSATVGNLAWSADGKFLFVGHSGGTSVMSIYRRDGSTLTKLGDPASMPDVAGQAKFSPNGKFLAIANGNNYPYINIYSIEGTTFTKLSNPVTLPTGMGLSVDWAPDSRYLTVGHNNWPYITSYKVDGEVFTKVANPVVDVPRNANGVDISPDGQFLAIGSYFSPFISFYRTASTAPIGAPALVSAPSYVEASYVDEAIARDSELPTRATLGLDTIDSVTLASLNATGTVTGSNLSGTNTGDQTITLTGDVTGSGTGTFATSIAPDSVAMGTDTTGDYLATLTGDSEIIVSGSGGEGSSPTLSIDASLARDSELPTRGSLGLNTSDQPVFAGVDAIDGAYLSTRSSEIDGAFFTGLAADAYKRLGIRADGDLEWGDGTNERDVVLSRSGVGELELVGDGGRSLVFDADSGAIRIHAEPSGGWATGLAFTSYDQSTRLGWFGAYGNQPDVLGYLWIGSEYDDNAVRIYPDKDVMFMGTGESTSSTTGSVKVSGGLGIAGNINVGGSMTASNFSGNSSGINTGDQSRADLGIDTTDQPVFAGLDAVDGSYLSTRNSVTDGAFFTGLAGDSVKRLGIRADGDLEWGAGISQRDTFLERVAPGMLKLSNRLNINTTDDITVGSSWEGNGDIALMAKGSDPEIALVGTDSDYWGALIELVQMKSATPTSYDNKWTIVRETNVAGNGDGSLHFKYGENVDGITNPSRLTVATDGSVSSSKMIIGKSAQNGVRETLLRGTVSDDGDSAIMLLNGTIGNENFAPTVAGFNQDDGGGMAVTGLTANDSGANTIVNFNAFITDDPSDPMNGNLAAPVVRPLFGWRTAGGIEYMQMNADGDLHIYSTTGSTSSTAGALTVAGGVGVEGNLNVGGNFSAANLTGTNTGDQSRADLGLDTTDSVAFGDLSLASSTPKLTLTDMGTSPATIELEADGNAAYYSRIGNDVASERAFFISQGGIDIFSSRSAGGYNGITIGSGSSTLKIFRNPVDKVEVGAITDSTSSSTGALTVAGGVGVAKNLHVGGDVTAGDFVSSSAVTTLKNDYGSGGVLRLDQDGGGSSAYMEISRSVTNPFLQFNFETDTNGKGFANFGGNSSAFKADNDPVNAFVIAPTYNQATGNWALTDLLIDRTETAIGSGEQYLIDAKVNDTSKFSVTNEGEVTVAGELKVSGTGNTVMKGPVLLVPQGDLPMGDFTEGADPNVL